MNFDKLFTLLAVALLVNACGDSKKISKSSPPKGEQVSNQPDAPPPISSKTLEVAKKRWTDASMEGLLSGKTIYESRCNQCHELYNIAGRDEEGWVKAIGWMAPKAKLTEAETETLKRYILAEREGLARK